MINRQIGKKSKARDLGEEAQCSQGIHMSYGRGRTHLLTETIIFLKKIFYKFLEVQKNDGKDSKLFKVVREIAYQLDLQGLCSRRDHIYVHDNRRRLLKIWERNKYIFRKILPVNQFLFFTTFLLNAFRTRPVAALMRITKRIHARTVNALHAVFL